MVTMSLSVPCMRRSSSPGTMEISIENTLYSRLCLSINKWSELLDSRVKLKRTLLWMTPPVLPQALPCIKGYWWEGPGCYTRHALCEQNVGHGRRVDPIRICQKQSKVLHCGEHEWDSRFLPRTKMKGTLWLTMGGGSWCWWGIFIHDRDGGDCAKVTTWISNTAWQTEITEAMAPERCWRKDLIQYYRTWNF